MTSDNSRIQKFTRIIVGYPIVLLMISTALNVFAFGVAPIAMELPAPPVTFILIVSAVLLLANHTWLMTSTELTRLNHKMYATPEEWEQNKTSRQDVSPQGWQELDRRHNAHRNTTENTIYFILLALIMSVVTPTIIAAQIWIGMFGLARLGYTYCYLTGKSGARGIFMSLTLLSLYGMASYLVIGLLV